MPTLLCCIADSLAGDGSVAAAARGRELAAWLRRLRRHDDVVISGMQVPMAQCAFVACPCHAGRGIPVLKRCTGCNSIWYCSREAQRADWARHKKECRPECGRRRRVNARHAPKPAADDRA